MKIRVTKTEMKKRWGRLLVFVPDGSMQCFKAVIDPFAYSTRAEGWACDYYDCGSFCISEGYDPAGKRIMNYEDFTPYREAHNKIKRNYDISVEEQNKRIAALFEDFKGDCKRRLRI